MNPATKPRLPASRRHEFVAASDAPRFNPDFVRRPRLIEALLESPPARLVTLTAPAGYSKTTCLAEWAVHERRPFAWVAVNRRHNDEVLLITSIVEALEEIEAIDPRVRASLAGPNPAISTVVLPRLGRSLQERIQPFVLAMDDFHVLTSTKALEVLETVLEYLPDGSQLAIASRAEPPLPLGRMRAHRQLVELTEPQLAMTKAESGELLSKVGLEPSSAQLDVLFERTEGWPAALYLVGLSLADQPNMSAAIASFAGDDRIVADYIRDEFLAATSPARLRFLTRSSIVEELSGPLCDAVLERSGSAGVLRELARSNSLVVRLDRSGSGYRYHHLFAEMLKGELRRREPEIEPKLHARVSRWYAAHFDADRAIDHAIAAGDVRWTGELIWRAFPEISGRGRIATLDRWLDTLGDDRIAASGPLSLATAHRHLVLGRGDRAAHWARVAVASADSSAKGGSSIQADIHLLDATLALDGVVRMGQDAERGSELHPSESPWQSPCFLYRGVSSHLSGHPERAVPLLQESARRGAVASPIIQVLSLAQLCLIAVEDDDWEAGSRLVAQARDQVSRCGLIDYPSILIVHAASALVRAREGKVERAEADFAQAMRLLALLADFPPWYEVEARLVLFRAGIRLDNLDGGRVLLDEASRLMERTPDATILRGWLDESRASLESASAEGRGRDWSLTRAELRTLQYLPSHLSFRQIAERIHVSPNTVKTQAQAVYRKLDASSRAEAVEIARGAGLLDTDPLKEN
jgi:LuxR family maltose regulon positive regulatory protein